MGVTTALEWLSSCSGCEISILNIGEALVPLLTEHLDIVHANTGSYTSIKKAKERLEECNK